MATQNNITNDNGIGLNKASKTVVDPLAETSHRYRSLAIPEAEDHDAVRKNYRPFILSPEITEGDWISRLELGTVVRMSEEDILRTGTRLKVLVLYGSLRQR